MHRRNFIKTAGSLTIAFTLGKWSPDDPMPFEQELPGSLRRQPNINAWLQVLANGRVRIFTGKLELGQGIRTAIAQVAAEELDMTMNNVEVVLAETGVTPNEGHTAGSGSIEQSAMSVRFASAAARQKLLQLASKKLSVPASDLDLQNGKIIVKKNNRSINFYDILDGKQMTDEVKLPVPLKSKEQYKLVGKAIHREDINHMVRGEPHFVQDLRFPGMVYARIVRPPVYTAELKSFDEQAVISKVKGYLKTVVNGSFLGVIAKHEYEAIQAQQLMQQHSTWNSKPLPAVKDLPAYLKSLPVRTQEVRNTGTINGNISLKASYFKPYIMHGSAGPSAAVALYDNNKLQVWSHSQGVYPLRETLSRLLNLPAENIHVKGVPGSGCYGHNGADDVAADVALLAMAYPGKHIMLQWSREDEHKWEPYGSAMIMELAAALDNNGKITGWQYEIWSDTHSTRPGGRPENTLAGRYIQKPFTVRSGGFSGGAYRNAEPYYEIPNQTIQAHFFDGPLRASALRSLGAYANIFAIECFMDELAEKAGKDPFTFRLMHQEDERAKAVIRKLREMVKDQSVPAGSGIGIGFSRYKNSASYCAVAALVKVNTAAGKIQVQKMWSAIDAGEAINIDGLKNQTEGGMVQSAGWTLMEQVTFDTQHITSDNWATYPVIRFNDSPETTVEVLNYPNEKAMGAGEAAQGPAAAAIANAIYRACGKRVRKLPVYGSLKSDV